MPGSNELDTEVQASYRSEEQPLESSELVRRAQDGLVSAVRELYLRHHQQIYRFIWARTHDPHRAEDLTGDVFVRMVTNLQGYQDQSLPFQAWLYRIAHNLVIDEYRKSNKHVSISLESVENVLIEHHTLEKTIETTLTMERVRTTLEKIPTDQREVVELRFLAGLSLNEVALAVNKTVSAVKALQHRGLLLLKEKLKE